MNAPLKQLIATVEIAAGEPITIKTETGDMVITITPVQNKFRTYAVEIERHPVTLDALKHVITSRRN